MGGNIKVNLKEIGTDTRNLVFILLRIRFIGELLWILVRDYTTKPLRWQNISNNQNWGLSEHSQGLWEFCESAVYQFNQWHMQIAAGKVRVWARVGQLLTTWHNHCLAYLLRYELQLHCESMLHSKLNTSQDRGMVLTKFPFS